MRLKIKKILFLSGDIFLLYFSLFLTLFIAFPKGLNSEIFFAHFFPFTILYLFWLVLFYIFDFYNLHSIKRKGDFFPRLLAGLFSTFILGIIFFYLFPFFGITPKTNLFINIAIFGILAVLWRKIFYFLFSSYFLNRVAIIGEENKIKDLEKEIEKRPYLGYKLISINPNENLLKQIKEKEIDTLIITENFKSNPQIVQNLYQCLRAGINFLDFSRAYEIICEKIPELYITETWFLENFKEGNKKNYNKIKKCLDLLFAFFILIITIPLSLIIALAVKLEDGGPVFYSQKRIGKNKKPFWLFKFRSMKENAEKDGPVFAGKKDSRTTKIGNFLRKTHLDELPQMLNILRGDISLTGPRPERPEFVKQLEKEISYYHLRHLIKPGFSGWAQIKFRYGRSFIDSREKFQYDLYYLKNRSFTLDLKILLKTFQLFFKKE